MTSNSITKQHIRPRITLITVTGLFAAMICITTAFIFHIPFGFNNGYIHMGDTLIYLAAALLPTRYAMIAAAVGGALADMFTAPMWMPATIIIKSLLTIPFTSKHAKIINIQNVIAVFLSSIISIIGYYLAEVVLLGTEAALVASITSSLIQAIGSGILFIVIGSTLDKTNFKMKL